VVRVPGYRSRGQGLIPGNTIFFPRSSGSGMGSTRPLDYTSIEELFERKSNGSCLESREQGRRDPSRWPRVNLYPQKLALTSPISGGGSVGIVRSLAQAIEFVLVLVMIQPLFHTQVCAPEDLCHDLVTQHLTTSSICKLWSVSVTRTLGWLQGRVVK
jgi:hypothetical protein